MHLGACVVEVEAYRRPEERQEHWRSPRTTKLYDRTSDEITLDEIERTCI
jgi:hypothetical protein